MLNHTSYHHYRWTSRTANKDIYRVYHEHYRAHCIGLFIGVLISEWYDIAFMEEKSGLTKRYISIKGIKTLHQYQVSSEVKEIPNEKWNSISTSVFAFSLPLTLHILLYVYLYNYNFYNLKEINDARNENLLSWLLFLCDSFCIKSIYVCRLIPISTLETSIKKYITLIY